MRFFFLLEISDPLIFLVGVKTLALPAQILYLKNQVKVDRLSSKTESIGDGTGRIP